MLACPLCNSASEASTAFDGSIYEGHVVICANGKCGCQSGTFPTPAMARRAWNTRSAALPKQSDPSRDSAAVQMFMAQLIVAENGSSLNGAITIPKQTLPASVYDAAIAAANRLAAKPVDDGVREAFKPFADFMAGSAFDKLPGEMPLTNGSGMARRQLTVGDFRKLREAIWPPKPYTLSTPSPGERT